MAGIIALIGSIVSGAALACAWVLTIALLRQPGSPWLARNVTGFLLLVTVSYALLVFFDLRGPVYRHDGLQSFQTLLSALMVIAIVGRASGRRATGREAHLVASPVARAAMLLCALAMPVCS